MKRRHKEGKLCKTKAGILCTPWCMDICKWKNNSGGREVYRNDFSVIFRKACRQSLLVSMHVYFLSAYFRWHPIYIWYKLCRVVKAVIAKTTIMTLGFENSKRKVAYIEHKLIQILIADPQYSIDKVLYILQVYVLRSFIKLIVYN